MTATTERGLGSFEHAQALTAWRFAYNLVLVARLAGPPVGDRLAAALERLRRRHALLRAIVEGSHRRPRLRLTDARDPIPLARLPRADAEAWRPVVERELVTPFELHRAPLARAVLLEGDGGADLIAAFPHLVVDGVAVGVFLDGLFEGLRRPEAAPPAAGALPPAADQLFPPSFCRPARWHRSLGFLARQMGDEASWRWRTRGRRARPRRGAFRCRLLTDTYSVAETESVVRASHARRTTLTSLFEAALLLAVVRSRYGTAELPHRYFAFPLLRPYLQPPVPAEVFGSYLTILRQTVEVGCATGPWQLAGQIQERLERAARRGDRWLASVWSPFSMRTVLSQAGCRMGTTAVSYTGPAALETGDPTLRIEALHAFVSNFPIGPEFCAQVRLFHHRLLWDFVYLDCDMDEAEARSIAAETRRIVTTATDHREGA